MAEEWGKFTPAKVPSGAEAEEWGELMVLTHGTHLGSAVRIAEVGAIEGGLIYDEKLP